MEKAKYKAKTAGFLRGKLGQYLPKGSVFEYEGKPGKWMVPLNEAAEAAVAAAKKGEGKFPSVAEARRNGEKVKALAAEKVAKPRQVKDDPNAHGDADETASKAADKSKAGGARGSKES